MSLFEEAEKNKNPFGLPKVNEAKEKNVAYINQTSILLKVLNEVCSEQLLSKEKKKQCSEHRSRLGDCSWPLHNLQGKVNEQTWQSIVQSAIKGMLKTIRNSQPNGEWMLMDYEEKIDFAPDGVERLYLVVKFVDIDNTEELLYRNGVPITTTVNVNTSPIAPEIVEALSSKSTDDGELKELIKQLVVAMSAGAIASNAQTTQEIETYPVPDEEKVVFDD